MKETQNMQIGSEYALHIGDIPSNDDDGNFSYLEGFQQAYFSSGRGALRAILRHLQKKRALLPEYICQSVIIAFELEGYEVSFYGITSTNSFEMGSLKKMLMETDVFLFMQYFGFLQDPEIIDEIRIFCEDNAVTIVEDTTHSIFSLPISLGHYAIASLRKWFGLPDGAVLYSKERSVSGLQYCIASSFTQMRVIGMLQKDLYLSGITEDSTFHRNLLSHAEAYLDETPNIDRMSNISSSILSRFDINAMISKRRDNYSLLFSLLMEQKINIITPPLDTGICPLFLIIQSEQRDRLRYFLSERNIFCPVHWPIEDNRLLVGRDFVKQIGRVLSIPIDQRYSSEEMLYISRMINEFGR